MASAIFWMVEIPGAPLYGLARVQARWLAGGIEGRVAGPAFACAARHHNWLGGWRKRGVGHPRMPGATGGSSTHVILVLWLLVLLGCFFG
jgi:hypothetical protein